MKQEDKTEEEIQEEEEIVHSSFAFEIDRFRIYVDRRQYTVYDASGAKKSEKTGKMALGTLIGYHRTLPDAFESIRDIKIKMSTKNTKTLEKALDAIIKADADWKLLMAPLKKLEAF